MTEELKHTQFKPTGLNVVVEPLTDQEQKTQAGIIMPTTVQRGVLKIGKVVAAGEGAWQFGTFITNPIKTDDLIVFDHRGTYDFTHTDRKTYVFVDNQLIKRRLIAPAETV